MTMELHPQLLIVFFIAGVGLDSRSVQDEVLYWVVPLFICYAWAHLNFSVSYMTDISQSRGLVTVDWFHLGLPAISSYLDSGYALLARMSSKGIDLPGALGRHTMPTWTTR